MNKIITCELIEAEVNKYDYELHKYRLPIANINECYEGNISKVIEAFNKINLPFKPALQIYSFMTEKEVAQVKKIKNILELKKIFSEKFKNKMRGMPKKLLTDLYISIVKFSNKHNFDVQQTATLLSIFYFIQQYVSYNLYISPEELYNIFKEYIFFHSITFPPEKIKVFNVYECKKIVLYFCSVYLRNLPLIRLLMLPNYGLIWKTKMEGEDVVMVKKKEKKTKSTKKKK